MSDNMAADIAGALATAAVGVVGTTIFYGELPDAVTVPAVLVTEYAGDPPLATFDRTPSGVLRPGCQVRTRATTYAAGRTLAGACFDALDGVTEATLGATRYLGIEARNSPWYLGRDERGRYEFAVNLNVTRER